MTDTNDTKEEAVVVKENPFISIHNEVKSRLVSTNDVVREKYIEAEVANKYVERVALVKSAVAKAVELDKEIKKAKPDQVLYDAEGGVVQEFYSKAVADKLKETKEKSAKLEAAIKKAFETADYSDLEKQCK
jgi:hypothetical protein